MRDLILAIYLTALLCAYISDRKCQRERYKTIMARAKLIETYNVGKTRAAENKVDDLKRQLDKKKARLKQKDLQIQTVKDNYKRLKLSIKEGKQ